MYCSWESQALELGSRLGYQHFFACFVDDFVRRNVLFVGMSVNDTVNIVGIGRNRAAGPVGNGTVGAQVSYQEHVVRAFFAHIVYSPLHRCVNFFTGLVFTETVWK